MKRTDYFWLFLICLAFLGGISAFQEVPGYMDADYYYAGGANIASGRGLVDSFIWNYLDEPKQIPHSSHSYWMPLPSLLSAAGMAIAGNTGYFAARWIFLILASLIPPITAWMGYKLAQQRSAGWIAGGLAIFSGFYAIYMGLVETFAVTILLGTAWLVLANSTIRPAIKYLVLGMITGLIHLARADGLVWLIFMLINIFISTRSKKNGKPFAWVLIGLAGYSLITGFWYGRNVIEFGSLLPPGNSRALWLVDYDQFYAFPASQLTFENWLGAGIAELLSQRVGALGENLKTLLAVQGQIFLLPLAIIGAWRLRRNPLIRWGLMIWGCVFLLMTVVFPLAGSRGGYFHSGSAFQPLIWALSPVGLMACIDLGIRKRGWKMGRALPGFGLLIILVAGLMSAGLIWVRVIGTDLTKPIWRESWDTYQSVEVFLKILGADDEDIVMVNNPPGYFIATGRQAIVIPWGDAAASLAAAAAYGADYLILDKNYVKGLEDLYLIPADRDQLKYLTTIESIHIYKIYP